MDDRISELPDEILSYIITMLSIKDLLKTSVFSKRWCKLWSLWRDLHFDIFHVLGSMEDPRHLLNSSLMERQVYLDINMAEFVKRVDQFLKNFQGTKINSFFVSFYSNDKHSDSIDQWISFAITRGVERINLLLLPIMPGSYVTPYKPYTFVFDLFSKTNASTLKHMRLEQCIVCHPTNCGYIPFKNLRSLSLYYTKVDEMFIENLLSNCQWLEEFHLFGCELRSSMPRIVSSSLCHLKVGGCYVISGNDIKDINLSLLDCLKLISLEYHSLEYDGYSSDTLNINTPLLKSIHCIVYYGDDPNQYALFATFPKLEIMRLVINLRVHTSLKVTQLFKHLKQLDIIIFSHVKMVEHSEYDLLGILTFLRASPLLHKLSVMELRVLGSRFSLLENSLRNNVELIRQKIVENHNVAKDVDMCSHDEVKVIEVRGCVGNWYEIEFVINVLQYAHKLERIVLSPYWREYGSLDWNYNPVWFQNGRQRINEKLQSENVVGREKLVLI